MSLFGKKNEEKKAAGCCCGCGQRKTEQPVEVKTCCGEKQGAICCIKVLGSGCKNCHTLYENAQKAAQAVGLGIKVEYVTDLQKVIAYGVMSMPALVVNEQVVSMGKVLKPEEIENIFRDRGMGKPADTIPDRNPSDQS